MLKMNACIRTLLLCLVGLGIALPVAGRSIQVGQGDDFQAALNKAEPGDIIVLQAGATFAGAFELPKKSGAGVITIQTSALESLPRPGSRVDPSFSRFMPKVVGASHERGYAITAAQGAGNYQFIGVEIMPAAGVFLWNVVLLGYGTENSLDKMPHNIVFDRCYIHGDPKVGSRRGIAMNGINLVLKNSYLSDIKEVEEESQGICGWSGPGPFVLHNNYIEAAGENVMFGGEDPAISNLVPSNIAITHNRFAKPLSWRVGHPSYAGTHWMVKNLLELKNAQDVIIDRNIFEYNWADAQQGFAIVITPRNQSGTAPWSVVQNVTFTNNIVRHSASGMVILGYDDNHRSRQANHITIRNNLFYDISTDWGGGGRWFHILNGTAHVTIDRNTALHTAAIAFADRKPHTNFVFTNNITPHNTGGPGYLRNMCGISGENSSPGKDALKRFFPGAAILNNVIYGTGPGDGITAKWLTANYPSGNYYLDSVRDVGFSGYSGGRQTASKPSDFAIVRPHFAPARRQRRTVTAPDGTVIGVNLRELPTE
ncbi:MAG: hypothetical protein HYX72_05040 [Acidobacteria bacterium]|nr:hypothetical protein [Acidobacteriota bacterium]